MSSKDQKVILCVDDDANLLRALLRLLRTTPYEVVTASNGDEAIALVEAKPPSMIILDVNMPRVGGFEVLRHLKENGSGDIPVVMLTGDGEPTDIMKGYTEGAMYYITKPFRNEYVLNIVEYLIGDLSEAERAEVEAQL